MSVALRGGAYTRFAKLLINSRCKTFLFFSKPPAPLSLSLSLSLFLSLPPAIHASTSLHEFKSKLFHHLRQTHSNC